MKIFNRELLLEKEAFEARDEDGDNVFFTISNVDIKHLFESKYEKRKVRRLYVLCNKILNQCSIICEYDNSEYIILHNEKGFLLSQSEKIILEELWHK